LELAGDDVIMDVEGFLYYMALFAVETIFGEKYRQREDIIISIVPYGSYEDASGVYVLEKKTRSLLAYIEGKTWHFSPETLEEDIEDLIEQLKRSKSLLGLRMIVEM